MQHFSLVLFICGLEASVGISCFLTEGEGGAGESGLSANHRQSMRTGGGGARDPGQRSAAETCGWFGGLFSS